MGSTTARTICLGAFLMAIACQGPQGERVTATGGDVKRQSAEVVTSAVGKPVDVYRDKWGISHVFAESNADLFFVQGYVTASDRLFNMDFNRRQAAGRLAEVFGKEQLADDRLMRTVGLTRVGKAALAQASPATREAIEAYTRGVNAFIDQHRQNLPEEFRIAGYEPEPWTALDSVICWKWFSWALTGSWRADAALAQIIDKVGESKAREVFPFYITGAPTIIGKGELKLPSTPPVPTTTTAAAFDQGTAVLNFSVGSNGWAVNGSKSVTGKPLLASNSHLVMTVPSGYYEIQLTGGDYDVTGVSIPGTPGIFLGHNRNIGWAVTRDAIDDVDVFIEKVDPANPLRYEHKGKWLQMATETQTINVKGGPADTLEIRSTIHGPVFSEFTGDSRVVTLKWVGYDVVANEIEPHLGINRAQTFDAFRESLRHYTIGGINYHYADTAGNIGVVSAGAIPIRATGRGIHAVPGWTGEYDWTGIVPYEHNPFLYNPERGYIDSANNKIIDDAEYPYYIGSRSSPYRAELIRDRMKAKEKFSIDDFKQMHSDVLAAPPRHLLPTVLPVLERNAGLSTAAKQALATLKAWDHRFNYDSTGATIYERFTTVLIRNTFRDEVGDDLFQRYFTGHRDGGNHQDAIGVVRRRLDSGRETRDAVVARSFEETVGELAGQLGADQSQWTWKRVNVIWINHRTPLSKDPVHGKRFNLGPFLEDGRRGWTINPVNGDIYEQIVDLSNIDNSIAMMPPGNSEHVDSPNYRDQVDLWIRGDYHPSFLSKPLVEAAAIEQTIVSPEVVEAAAVSGLRDTGGAMSTTFSRKPVAVAMVIAWTAAAVPSSAQDWMAQLSKPIHEVKQDVDVQVPMRDGIKLSTDLYIPSGPNVTATRFPTILMRTPYDNNAVGNVKDGHYYAMRGYVVAVQDTRGRYDSEGAFVPARSDAKDGYDTIEWIAKQPWSDGKVGMLGSSYLGIVQLLAATETPPHLTAIFPRVAYSDQYKQWTFTGGAFALGLNQWWMGVLMSTRTAQNQYSRSLHTGKSHRGHRNVQGRLLDVARS